MSKPGKLLRLNLGCGNDIRPGYVNHDIARHRPEVDVVHDLRTLPWPWQDGVAAEIQLMDVVEHLPDVVAVIDECWRILAPGGVLHVSVPHYESENAWIDPTHRRGFHLDSFDYFDPATHWGATFGFYTPRKWQIQHKELLDGNVRVTMSSRKDAEVDWSSLSPQRKLSEQAVKAADEISSLTAQNASFVLVDNNEMGDEITPGGRRKVPFIERNGEYWGPPEDDMTATLELERLRREGASHVVFAWPAFWWLNHYARFSQYLRENYCCVLENERLIVFDLRTATPPAANETR